MNKIERLTKSAVAVDTGKIAAAKVVEYTRDTDGKLIRQEVDPEEHRKEAARNFEVKSAVAKLRQELNLSQKAFSQRLRIPLSTLRKWEQLETEPSGAAKTLLEVISKKPEVMDLIES